MSTTGCVSVLSNYYNSLIKRISRNLLRQYVNQYNNTIRQLIATRNQKIQVINNTPDKQPSKYALLIGINYLDTEYKLSGCINDVTNIQQLLKEKYSYDNNDIILLTDNTEIKPTRNNILEQLKSILSKAGYGDNIFILFSGHGTNTYDINKDEADGMDEMIVSLDFKAIIDDELREIFRRYSKVGVNVFAMFDSCFSGTVLDLKYVYSEDNIVNNYTETNSRIVMISGCKDNQTSEDAYIKDNFSGAMTYSFLEVLKQNETQTITFINLVKQMREVLKTSGFTQYPLLSWGKNEKMEEAIVNF